MLGRVWVQAFSRQQPDTDTSHFYENSTKRFKSVDGSGSPQEPISVLDTRSPSPTSSSLSSLQSNGEGNIGSSLFNERKLGDTLRLGTIGPEPKSSLTAKVSEENIGLQSSSGQQNGMGRELQEFRKRGYDTVESCGPSHLAMSNCFDVAARSVDVNAKGRERDELSERYSILRQDVKVERPSAMNSLSSAVYESSPYHPPFMGEGMGERRELNPPVGQFFSKPGGQGNVFVSSGGAMRDPQGASTEGSVVNNAGSNSDVTGSGTESTRLNPIRGGVEEWWVDYLAPSSMPPTHSISQQENTFLSTNSEFGVLKQPTHMEDLESMLLMSSSQPPDQTLMKWLMGDGQSGAHPPVQRARGDMDTVMFEQDSWSSNQHQSSHQSGSHEIPFTGQTSQEHTATDTFSSSSPYSLNTSVSLSPSSPNPNSENSFLSSSYASLPRALSLPSHLRDISLNSPDRSEVAVPSSTSSPVGLTVGGPTGQPFSAPSSFLGSLPDSPDGSAPGHYYAQTILAGIPISPGRGAHLSQETTFGSHQTSLAMEDAPQPMQVGQGSPSQLRTFRASLPSLVPTGYFQDTKDFAQQRGLLQRSFSSLPTTDSQSQQMKIPAIPHRDFLLQRQLSWNSGRTPPQKHLIAENRSPKPLGDWKIETMKNRTGGALSPLSSVPGFNLRSPQQGGFQSPDRKEENINFDTGQGAGGVIPEGGLTVVNLLLRAAEAVDVGNPEMAKAILARLNRHISPTRGKSIHRVAHYFREALITRIMGAENMSVQLSHDRTLPPVEEFHKIRAYVQFCEVSPFPKFSHFTANQAILEALEGEESMHVVDFQMGAGAQWASFIQDISSLRALGKSVPSLRLTAVGTRSDEMHATGANICSFARAMNISLEFQAIVTKPECLEVSMLGLRDTEAVAVNFVFGLHRLLDGEASSGLTTVLKAVREARPKVVTTVEQEANHSGPFFQQRFSEALQYYTFLFDSLTSSFEAGADSSINSSIENYLLAPEIMNIVACEGPARVERHECLEQWRGHMRSVGFHPRPLSEASQFQAEKLVAAQTFARKGFKIWRDKGSLLLGWQGRALLAASSWVC